MSEPADVVLAYWRDHRDQLRQSENQRAVLTNYVLVIVAALSGFIVQQQLKPATVPLSVLITIIGVFGAITVAKYHERANYHLAQARTAHPRLHRIHLHRLWTGLHIGIALYGATLTIITALR